MADERRCNTCLSIMGEDTTTCPECGEDNVPLERMLPKNKRSKHRVRCEWISIEKDTTNCTWCVNFKLCELIQNRISSTTRGQYRFRCPVLSNTDPHIEYNKPHRAILDDSELKDSEAIRIIERYRNGEPMEDLTH